LSAETICADGVKLIGWIANRVVSGYSEVEETLNILAKHISAPLLATVDYTDKLDVEKMASEIDLAALCN
jgi:dethiobiotin synthetase